MVHSPLPGTVNFSNSVLIFHSVVLRQGLVQNTESVTLQAPGKEGSYSVTDGATATFPQRWASYAWHPANGAPTQELTDHQMLEDGAGFQGW
jgi:hypothetical protein